MGGLGATQALDVRKYFTKCSTAGAFTSNSPLESEPDNNRNISDQRQTLFMFHSRNSCSYFLSPRGEESL